MRQRNGNLLSTFAWLAVVGLSAAAGCAKKSTGEAAGGAAIDGVVAKPGSFLAYEHEVAIVLPQGEDAATRVARIRAACDDGRFGACTVLEIVTEHGDLAESSIRMRVDPKGVEPLVSLAAKAAQIGSRKTHAEDLGEVVRDTARSRATLQRRHAKLLELQARAGLSVIDLLTLSNETAAIETALEEAENNAAQLQRRIETNLLRITFGQGHDESRTGRIGTAFGASLDQATDGIAEAVGALAFGLPFLLIVFPLALLWRMAWRRLTGGASRRQ